MNLLALLLPSVRQTNSSEPEPDDLRVGVGVRPTELQLCLVLGMNLEERFA